MVQTIAKVTIYVDDVLMAKKFWIEQMAFVVREEKKMGPSMIWLEVAPTEACETTFVIYDRKLMKQQNPEANVGHPSLILSCKDINDAYEILKGNGVQIDAVQEHPYGKTCHFYDQDQQAYFMRED